MPLSEINRYRLNAVSRYADETATNVLQGEANQREQEEAARQAAQKEARRQATARVLSGFSARGGPDEVYGNVTRTMMGLLAIGGPEAEKASEVVSKVPAEYAALHPTKATPERKRKFVDIAASPSPQWPMTKKFGDNVHRLQQEIYEDTNQPTGFYQYAQGGTLPEAKPGSSQAEKDVEKYADLYLKHAATVNGLEARYGKERLAQWREELKKDPEAQKVMAAPSDYDREQLMKDATAKLYASIAGTDSDKIKASQLWAEKVKALSDYDKALPEKDRYAKNLMRHHKVVNEDTGETEDYNPQQVMSKAREHLRTKGYANDDASVKLFLQQNPSFK